MASDDSGSVVERTAGEAAAQPPAPEDMQVSFQADTQKLPNNPQSRQISPTLPTSTDLNRNRVEANKADTPLSLVGSTVVVNLCPTEGLDVMDEEEEDIVLIPHEQMKEEKQDDSAVNKFVSNGQTGEDLQDDIPILGENGEGKHSPMQFGEDDIMLDQLKRDEELARQLQAEDEVDRETARRLQEEEDARLAAQLWEQVNSDAEEDVIGLSAPDDDSVVSVTDSYGEDDDDDSVIITQDMQIKHDEEMARQLEQQLERRDHESDSDVHLVQEFEDSQLARELSHKEASSYSTVTSDGRHMTALERMKVQVELNKREKEKQKANFKKKCSKQVAHGRQQLQQLQSTPERRTALQQAQSGLNQWMKYKAPWEKGHRKKNLMPRQTLDGPIPCPVINCAARFATPYMLTAHMETFCHSPCNPTGTLQLSKRDGLDKCACVVCGKHFLGRAAHDHHVDMAMKDPKLTHHWRLPGVPILCFACPACGLCFGRSEECMAHIMERRHQHYPDIQPIPLTRSIYLQLTAKCEQVKFTVKCNECPASFARHSQIQRHYVTNGCHGSPVATAGKSILAVLKEMTPVYYCAECNITFTSFQAVSIHSQSAHRGTVRFLKLKEDKMAMLFLTLGWQAETTGLNRQQTTWPWRRLAVPLKAVVSKAAATATASSPSSSVSSPSAASARPNILNSVQLQGNQLVRFPFPQASTSVVSKAPNSYPRPGVQAPPMTQLPFNQTVRFPLLPRPPASTEPQPYRHLLDMNAPGINSKVMNQLAATGNTGTKRCRSESGGHRSAVVPPANKTLPSTANKKKKKKAKHQQTFVMSPHIIDAPGPSAKRAKHISGTSGIVSTGLGTTGSSGTSSSVPDPPEDVCHVIFVDLDNWGSFFSKLPQPLTDKTFVYGFKGGSCIWCPPRNNRAYDTIMSKKCFYLHPQCSKRKDAADFAICVHAGRLDERIPKCVPFTVLSGDGGFHELANQLQRSNRRTHIVSPHHQDADIILATLNSIGET
ncbi:E3 SUMO-protein ligase ZNF451-like [Branchiostoma lanceolatum]|uniref:E3 SUMO-protein ligase ZNF451-like n=1 Tax=Branchiostoma lanceolatum TaxID=7740 RepID=UPI003451DC40